MENRQNTSTLLEQLDLYSIVRDVLRNLWVILLAALAVGMIVYMGSRAQSKNTYPTRATFVVTSKTSGNYTYSNLSAATTMADSFSNAAPSVSGLINDIKACLDIETGLIAGIAL